MSIECTICHHIDITCLLGLVSVTSMLSEQLIRLHLLQLCLLSVSMNDQQLLLLYHKEQQLYRFLSSSARFQKFCHKCDHRNIIVENSQTFPSCMNLKCLCTLILVFEMGTHFETCLQWDMESITWDQSVSSTTPEGLQSELSDETMKSLLKKCKNVTILNWMPTLVYSQCRLCIEWIQRTLACTNIMVPNVLERSSSWDYDLVIQR